MFGTASTKIGPKELREVKVYIHRNIPGRATTHELKRDVPNAEEVVLKRRAGEGSKPIFDREEIKRAIIQTGEVEELRTIVIMNLENSENKSRRHSASLSATRTRRHSPRSKSSHHPRHDDSKHQHKASYRSDRGNPGRSKDNFLDMRKTDRSRESSRERREPDRRRE